jgi:hypothetical protein
LRLPSGRSTTIAASKTVIAASMSFRSIGVLLLGFADASTDWQRPMFARVDGDYVLIFWPLVPSENMAVVNPRSSASVWVNDLVRVCAAFR